MRMLACKACNTQPRPGAVPEGFTSLRLWIPSPSTEPLRYHQENQGANPSVTSHETICDPLGRRSGLGSRHAGGAKLVPFNPLCRVAGSVL